MRLTRSFTTPVSALLVLFSSAANAAVPPCLTAGEFTSLATYALPSMISGTSQRCATRLSANAYLRRNGSELVSRYSQRKASSWPGAKAAFLKLSASTNNDANNLIRSLPDSSMQPMLDSLMEGMISQRIPLDRCTTIDRAIGLLAPLPAENTAELIALAVGLGAKTGTSTGSGKLGAISICPA